MEQLPMLKAVREANRRLELGEATGLASPKWQEVRERGQEKGRLNSKGIKVAQILCSWENHCMALR